MDPLIKITDRLTEYGTFLVAFVKASKIYLFFVAFFSWIFSTYDIKEILFLFMMATTLDTITRINTNAKLKGLYFNPFRKFFWLQIKSEGLKKMGRKVFFEYSVYVIVAFALDTWVFKNKLHFDFMSLKLNIPTFAILFFTGIEIWSIFENMEEGGTKNYLKIGLRFFNKFLPEKWQKIYNDVMTPPKKTTRKPRNK